MKKIVLSRVFQFGIGVLITQVLGYVFDYIAYPIITYSFKLWEGALIMFVLSLVLNYSLVLVYDFFKKDLFGFEEIKTFKHSVETNSWKEKMLKKIIHYGDIPAFIALSFYDPFLAVLYKRDSKEFDGFKKKDYLNLIIATVIGCFIWSLIWNIILYFVP